MEKITEFLNHLKERLSNPFFSSFIISWLISNWKIVIGLFFLSFDEIKLEGASSSYFSFISNNLSWESSFWIPLGCSLSYILLSPILRNLLSAFNSWAFKWGNRWNLTILGKGKIGIEKYLTMKDQLEKRTLALEDIIEKESVHLKEVNELRDYKLRTSIEKNELERELNDIKKSTDVKFLTGRWQNNHENPIGVRGGEYLEIEGDKYYQILEGKKKLAFTIKHFQINPLTSEVFFIKEYTNEYYAEIPKTDIRPKCLVNELMLNNDGSLEGIEDGRIPIKYTKD